MKFDDTMKSHYYFVTIYGCKGLMEKVKLGNNSPTKHRPDIIINKLNFCDKFEAFVLNEQLGDVELMHEFNKISVNKISK